MTDEKREEILNLLLKGCSVGSIYRRKYSYLFI